MGQLNNLYVSSSFQGLLKLTDSTQGLTNTLQTVQAGNGSDSPLQISNTAVNISGSFTINNQPISIETGSFATTGSNVFVGKQTITGSNGYLIYDGTTNATPNNALGEVHADNDSPWLERFYNDSFSSSSSVMSYFGWNDGRFIFHNDSTQSIAISVDGYYNDNLVVSNTNTTSNNDLIVTGSIDITGQYFVNGVPFSGGTSGTSGSNGTDGTSGSNGTDGSSGSNGTDGSSGSSGSNGTDGSSGSNGTDGTSGSNGTDGTSGSNGTDGSSGTSGDSLFAQTGSYWATTNDLQITGSLSVTNIIGTGSLFLQPNQADARFLEIYNTSPTDTHITASGGQLYLGNDVTYVKVDNYGSVKHIDIVADNGVNVSGSLTVTGSVKITSQTGTPLTVDHNDATPNQNTLIGFLDSGSAVWSIGNSGTNNNFVVYNPDTFATPLSIGQDNSTQLYGNAGITGSLNISGSLLNVQTYGTNNGVNIIDVDGNGSASFVLSENNGQYPGLDVYTRPDVYNDPGNGNGYYGFISIDPIDITNPNTPDTNRSIGLNSTNYYGTGTGTWRGSLYGGQNAAEILAVNDDVDTVLTDRTWNFTNKITGSLRVNSIKVDNVLSFTSSIFAQDVSSSMYLQQLNTYQWAFNQFDNNDFNTGTQFLATTNKDNNFTSVNLKARFIGHPDADIYVENTGGISQVLTNTNLVNLANEVTIAGVNPLLNITPQATLPTPYVMGVCSLAVSGSHLYFYNGSGWSQII